jgi:hypothetical protein
MLFGIFEVFQKLLVKICESILPSLFALFDFVEIFFQPCGVLDIENVAEVFDQQACDARPISRGEFRRASARAAALNRGENRGMVGAADAAFLSLTSEASL